MRSKVDRDHAKRCVGPGWSDLIDQVFNLLESHRTEATQVKEKFGLLRVYTYPASEELYDKIEEIEKRSGKICETCGAPGRTLNRGGWLRTICEGCVEKLK